ncbi:MAG: M12 family metallo-peptidase [Tannerella sp.]|jgi:hypothetical protein|nr:M12 family metallo-peptidase [Tannerella sp.]
MKKSITIFTLIVISIGGYAQNYWTQTSAPVERELKSVSPVNYYKLDIGKIRQELAVAPLNTEKGAQPVVISVPTLEGKVERFAVYSFPVMEKNMADHYQLGSYVGNGIDDPSKYIRFSVSPTKFQSMIIKNGEMQFIDPMDKEATVFGVYPKSNKNGAFKCFTTESIQSKEELAKLVEAGQQLTNSLGYVVLSTDQKFRTMRLALSVTGEYTTYFGGVNGALAQMNATMTRVNGVFETDFTLHLNLVDAPELIYTDAATDPYSTVTPPNYEEMDNWSDELTQTLHAWGDDKFDIGHLFGQLGGGGYAGCIGCVCSNTLTNYKGSGITSPYDGKPLGDNFDIDYVAHEMGHQLGANHTFAMTLESGTGANMEPGSGSTIMGYAGITSANVQAHSDAYFHAFSIKQVSDNLVSKTCDVETDISDINTAPTIDVLPTYTIPKSTAFVLKANATDAEGDALTYTWEEYDNASTQITKSNLGNTTSGASFRSLQGTSNPERYFPKFSTVIGGNLKNLSEWEAVSTVARSSKYAVTVRDFHAPAPQTNVRIQTITIGSNGPFQITNVGSLYNNILNNITWDVANTNTSPYNVSDVKIDYTEDQGASWTVLTDATPNDGSEEFDLSYISEGTKIILRISAINSVFYAVSTPLEIKSAETCDGSAPHNVTVSISDVSALISWEVFEGAEKYIVEYRPAGETDWTTIETTDANYTIISLTYSTTYEVQVAAVCSGGAQGVFSNPVQFTIPLNYCAVSSGTFSDERIGTVKVNDFENISDVAGFTSTGSGYEDFTNLGPIPLKVGSTDNTISVTKVWSGTKYSEAVAVWIDFNGDGTFDNTSERILNTAANQTTPVTGTFSVPSSVIVGKKVGMRVILKYGAAVTSACTDITYGQIEDYTVEFIETMATEDVLNKDAKGIVIYPNPATDLLNITNVKPNSVYQIYSMSGQLAATGKIADGKVNIHSLTAGNYVIFITNGETKTSIKFIKK